jgi:polyhydroxyalkanoate synthesis regulator phasin
VYYSKFDPSTLSTLSDIAALAKRVKVLEEKVKVLEEKVKRLEEAGP